MTLKVSQVFGVSKDMVHSYIERAQVDAKFKEALEGDNILLYMGLLNRVNLLLEESISQKKKRY